MSQQIERLNEIASKLGKQNKILCCKLDSMITAVGGSPVLYNTPQLIRVIAGSSIEITDEVHSITIISVGAAGESSVIQVNGDETTVPSGTSLSWEASTVFPTNTFKVINTGTATTFISILKA